MQSRNLVELKKLCVGYDGKALLSEISLSIRPGTIVTLIGPNGSGKSTILKTLARHLPPVSGAVYVDGKELQGLSAAALARLLSIVMTERVHTNFMTCRDVAAAGRYPHTGRLGVLSAEDKKKVERALHLVHADEVADKDFMKVSDGQRQRVMLARALCQEPRVLLLDEPTSYLDLAYKLDLLQAIRDAARQDNIAVIMSLHELNLAQAVSDRILAVSDQGHVLEGTPEEIFQDGRIQELYHLPDQAYDLRTGSCFLPPVKGEPVVFMLGGAGTGIGTCYRLQREGVPFAAGIYMENDVEFPAARALSRVCLHTPAYAQPKESDIRQAMELIDRCPQFLAPVAASDCRYAGVDALLSYAKEKGKWQA